MGDQNHHHASLVPKLLEKVHDLAPVGESVGVSLAVAAISFFDVPDSVFPAYLVEDQPLQPVGGIHDHRLKVVLFIAQRGQLGQHFGERVRQRELVAVEFPQTVLGLDEDRVRRGGSEGRFPDSLASVDHDARRPVLAAGLDGIKHSHSMFLLIVSCFLLLPGADFPSRRLFRKHISQSAPGAPVLHTGFPGIRGFPAQSLWRPF